MLADIHWPEGLNTERFLAEYWQQKPLLIRQAFPDFRTPLPADELAGLSLEPDTTPRLILKDNEGNYTLEHGPFDEERFATLGAAGWSLLVTDVEKHLPELQAYLYPFRFIPSWRIDDLMVSYAPDGASVGAHVDDYDVFLLQASGTRRWGYSAPQERPPHLVPGASLKLLANFEPNDTEDLQPGDMLYLPPGAPHHGLAVGDDCTTWSVGFRAPAQSDMLSVFSEKLLASFESGERKDQRFRDASPSDWLHNNERAPGGEINEASVQTLKTLWRDLTALSDKDFRHLCGVLLTNNSNHLSFGPDVSDSDADLPQEPERTCARRALAVQPCWYRNAFSQFAFLIDDDATQQATLFVDGQGFSCEPNVARALCRSTLSNPVDLTRFQPLSDPLWRWLMDGQRVLPTL